MIIEFLGTQKNIQINQFKIYLVVLNMKNINI